MGINLRYFSVEEAETLISQITEIFASAQQTKILIEEKVENWRRIHKKLAPADEAVIRGQVDFLASQLESQLGQITELGATPKDLDMGLVDFPARIEGQEGYLCWRVGEKKIKYWHSLTDGYKGRKPLPKNET